MWLCDPLCSSIFAQHRGKVWNESWERLYKQACYWNNKLLNALVQSLTLQEGYRYHPQDWWGLCSWNHQRTATTTQKLEVSLGEQALTPLQILIIQKKVQAIKYINSKSPLLCTKLITKPRIWGFRPINGLHFSTTLFEDSTFIKRFQKYIFDHKSFPTCKQFEKTKLGFIIYENKKLVSLIDFHPIHNSERFFFNVLLVWPVPLAQVLPRFQIFPTTPKAHSNSFEIFSYDLI